MRALRRVRVKDSRNLSRQEPPNIFLELPARKSFREQVSAWWGDQLDK